MMRLNQAANKPITEDSFVVPSEREPEALLKVEHLSRPKAIERLRERLKTFTDDDHCVCAAVGRLGIFCRGFRRLSPEEFRRRFDWIARKRPGASRETLEELASLYHLARQEVTGAATCCDLETREHSGCDGWNAFDNRALEQFCLALTGRPVRIG